MIWTALQHPEWGRGIVQAAGLLGPEIPLDAWVQEVLEALPVTLRDEPS